ncbi:tethering complex subunit VPS16 [Nakaseomyces bracarensis]|uniref:tethering complex subunit VPS16 n=1 Tax=Nakaseomyces bracarensis TaxID=273131 RepID=UPI0038723DA1
MLKNPSFDWEKLGETFWRSTEICQLEWFTLNQVNSGILPDDDNGEVVRHAVSLFWLAVELDRSVQIYDRVGHKITSLPLDTARKGDLVKFVFDNDDKLRIIYSRCIDIIHDWNLGDVESVYLPDDIEDTIWDYKNEVLVLRSSKNIYKITGGKFELVLSNAESYTLLTRNSWDYRDGELYIADIKHVYCFSTSNMNIRRFLNDSQFQRVILSGGNDICFYDAKKNEVNIYSNNGQLVLKHILQRIPQDIKWVSVSHLAVIYDDEALILGLDDTYINFWYPYDIVSVTGFMDGILVITTNSFNFISQVKKSTANIFRIGSVAPGALLLDAYNILEKSAPKAIESLKNIDLYIAVVDCIEASLEESDPQLQKILLSTAAFGKESLPYKKFDSNIFVKTCQKLKILNFLHSIGVYVTNSQYDFLGLKSIIDALINSRLYLEAFKLLQLADEPSYKSKVFIKWAITKIKFSNDANDEELLKVIQERRSTIKEKIYISMASISEFAYSEGRFKLARELCLFEDFSPNKVGMLVKLEDYNLALSECLKEKSTSLTISLLLVLKKKLSAAQFTRMLTLDMNDRQLFIFFARHDTEFLYDYYRQTDNFEDLAQVIRVSRSSKVPLKAVLAQILELYNTTPHKSDILKQDISLLQREARLESLKSDLTAKYGVDFENDLTVDETLIKLIKGRQDRAIKELVKKFDIPDRKYQILVLKTYVSDKAFDDLYKFMTDRKPVFGYQYIFDYLKRSGHKTEAARYIVFLQRPYAEKIQFYLEARDYRGAVELAGKEKDVHGLKDIYAKIPQNEPQVKSLANQILATL